jgi:subtilisin family serine protease
VLHDFGGGNTANPITQGSPLIDLFWADPLGASTNDYTLFILDYTGSIVKGVATSGQFGTQDPFAEVSIYDDNYDLPAVGDMIVIARSTKSAPVAMHVETFGYSPLLFATTGSTHGHNGGASTQSMAATFWNSAHNGTKPFNGPNNLVEPFSSDGPRKIFFNPDGSAITPGNFRFSTNGGTTLQKPDFTAADGVTTRTGGPFNPFFGTSAATPHACGVAALIKSANPGITNTQIRNIMISTAHGIPTPGWNRDAGFGVLDVSAALK